MSGRGGRGRGEYYKNKYGGGGRGGRGRGGGRGGRSQRAPRTSNAGGTFDDFTNLLKQIDGSSYPSYHDIETTSGWRHRDFVLYVGRAQSDPFAPPTRCCVVVSSEYAKFPPSTYSNKVRALGLSDYLHRALYAHCKEMGADTYFQNKGWGSPKGGDIQILQPCQHVLEQTAVQVSSDGTITVQVTINLPARGRTVLGLAAEEIFGSTLVSLLQKALNYQSLNGPRLAFHVDSIEDQIWLRDQLVGQQLVAFVKNGAILPRVSGVDDRPMDASKAILFASPPSLQVSFTLPNAGVEITGMGLRSGINLICGGGFHGKSTLLEALEVGVYPKMPGDGREFCVSLESASKIRAEDGRAVTAVDISPFISNLPFGRDTTCFTTSDASGSTSQASSIVESLEAGSRLLLMDEDTCATNFMIRDEKMMQLVAPEKEPITPLLHKLRSLTEDKAISSILVMGGSGDYFDIADTVVMMDCYKCHDVTENAKKIAASSTKSQRNLPFGGIQPRYPNGTSFLEEGKIAARSESLISYGDTDVDLSGVEQIVSKGQTNTLAYVLKTVGRVASSGTLTLQQVLDRLEQQLDEGGLGTLVPNTFHGGLARPRRSDIACAINRLRRPGSISQR